MRSVRLVLHVPIAPRQGFNHGASVTVAVRGSKSCDVSAGEHGYVPAGGFRAGDNDPRVGTPSQAAPGDDDRAAAVQEPTCYYELLSYIFDTGRGQGLKD